MRTLFLRTLHRGTRHRGTLLQVAIAASVLSPATGATTAPTQEPDQESETATQVVELPALELTLDLSAFESLAGETVDLGQLRGHWTGTLNGAALRLELTAFNRTQFTTLDDPHDVANVVYFNSSNRSREKDVFFDFSISRPFTGPVGELPYGWFAVHDVYDGTSKSGHGIYVCGLVERFGYVLELRATDPLEPAAIDAIQEWAQSAIRYSGAVLDPNWTEDEALDRYMGGAPDTLLAAFEKRKKKPRIARTEHYIVFTDIGPGTLKGFARALEQNYDEIRSVFPFGDVEGQRLMPVFYFNNADDYYGWYVKNLGAKRESAERSAGVASGDVYATYHQAPKAPVHIHEQTHQLFKNRLHLGGGGSWFQEGVAEYMSSKPGDLGEIKRRARAEDGLTPLEEFVVVPSLLMSSKKGSRKDGGSNSGAAYDQAAAVIEFAKHSKFGKERFLEWVHAMGRVGRGDLPAIERATARVYGVSLAGFEEKFLAYWSKRRGVKDWHAPARKSK